MGSARTWPHIWIILLKVSNSEKQNKYFWLAESNFPQETYQLEAQYPKFHPTG